MPTVIATPVQHSGAPRRSRNIEERLMIRFPGVWRAVTALGLRLFSPRSRLRRTLLRRSVVSGWEAASRRDFELMHIRYAPDVEIEYDSDFEVLGLGGRYRGHDGHLKIVDLSEEAWERWEMLLEVVLDMGDRLLVLGTVRLPGNLSGLQLEREFAQLMTLRGVLVTHEQLFFGWDRGLRAAGLDPDAIALPSLEKGDQAPSSAG
jgi:hypothetical protein